MVLTKTINFLDKVKESIEPFISKSYDELKTYTNVDTINKMFMKRELLLTKVFGLTKKRYILNVWDSEGVSYKQD